MLAGAARAMCVGRAGARRRGNGHSAREGDARDAREEAKRAMCRVVVVVVVVVVAGDVSDGIARGGVTRRVDGTAGLGTGDERRVHSTELSYT